jgi:hypothetical protein
MSMLHGASLSNGFWEYAICAATHTYNRTPSRGLQWHTPHECWDAGHVPDVSYFRVFGCKAYMHIPKDERKKLDEKSIMTTLIGYESGSKGYRLWDKQMCSVKLSRYVTFDESSFPSLQTDEPQSTKSQESTQDHITFFLVSLAPPMQAPSHPSDDDEDDDDERIKDLINPKVEPKQERPLTPPPSRPAPPTTPAQKTELPTSPPPRQCAE